MQACWPANCQKEHYFKNIPVKTIKSVGVRCGEWHCSSSLVTCVQRNMKTGSPVISSPVLLLLYIMKKQSMCSSTYIVNVSLKFCVICYIVFTVYPIQQNSSSLILKEILVLSTSVNTCEQDFKETRRWETFLLSPVSFWQKYLSMLFAYVKGTKRLVHWQKCNGFELHTDFLDVIYKVLIQELH